jgi:predicted Rossmann-fold nucleotide-binding protein
MVAGGVGSLTEVAIAYNLKKPVIILTGTGMMADRIKELFPDGFLDHRHLVKINFVDNPSDACDLAVRLAKGHADTAKKP